MNFASVEAIANAVLFEGYILYPYRPSAIKNQQRWNFGTLYPRTFAETQTPPERWRIQAQVLLHADADTLLYTRMRFLQLAAAGECAQNWRQGYARSHTTDAITFSQLCMGYEQIWDLRALSAEVLAAAPLRTDEYNGMGRLVCSAERVQDEIYRLTVTFANETPVTALDLCLRDSLQAAAFISAHLLLGTERGSFISLLEPPPELAHEAAACVQDGVFPVLAGEAGARSCMFVSPIILYDYPQVAPESPGDFFDGTEMDEMLALRVLTLTEEEKAEMRRSDLHARAILERTEALPNEQLLKVHGAVRGLRRVMQQDLEESTQTEALALSHEATDPFAERPPLQSVRVFGIDLRTGDRVRLWPQKKADIMDMEMEGKVAIIEAIEQDFEDNVQLAVVLEDDPGRDMGMLRQAGHRFFFSPEEVEPLRLEVS